MTISPRVGARRASGATATARSSGPRGVGGPAPGRVAPTLGIPTYCPDCEGVCGSYDPLDACRCVDCPRCAELDEADMRRWLGTDRITTVNPKGGAL